MDIYGDTAVIGARLGDGRGNYNGSSYVYTNIGGTWIHNGNIVSDNGAAYDNFGYIVALLRSTARIGAPYGV